MACDKNVCKNPVYSVNSCCPICLDPCKFQTEIIEHGELFEFNKCTICQCNNGKISNCNKTSQKTISTTSTTSTLTLTLTLNSKCPPINCPEENNVIMDENCCQICPKHDYCLKFAPSFCDEFASCYNLNDSFECECNRGYFGNGTTCEDIDECLQTQNMFGHNCNLSRSQCVNTIGSYYCECKVGFENVDNLTCADVNECLTRGHKCDANARCSNFDGGYRCECNENYVGNGFYCEGKFDNNSADRTFLKIYFKSVKKIFKIFLCQLKISSTFRYFSTNLEFQKVIKKVTFAPPDWYSFIKYHALFDDVAVLKV